MKLDIFLCCFFATTASLQRATWAYLWPLVISETHPGPESTRDGLEDHTVQHPRSLQRQNQVINGTLPCTRDKSCGRGLYCDLHYGDCRSQKSAGDLCRRDGHCKKGLDCRFGTCQPTVEPRTVGARCRSDRDCAENQCCARQHGESICKAKLQVGAKCYVPEGGIDYVINSICPCDTGLVCKMTRHHKRRSAGRDATARYWTDRNHMRCKQP